MRAHIVFTSERLILSRISSDNKYQSRCQNRTHREIPRLQVVYIFWIELINNDCSNSKSKRGQIRRDIPNREDWQRSSTSCIDSGASSTLGKLQHDHKLTLAIKMANYLSFCISLKTAERSEAKSDMRSFASCIKIWDVLTRSFASLLATLRSAVLA